MPGIFFDKTTTFQDFGLDRRIYKAIAKRGIIYPSLVQSKCIPIVLQGKDVLVRSRTGSGKTLAFCIPIVSNILSTLSDETDSPNQRGVRALVLVPTRELCDQVATQFRHLLFYCHDCISMLSVSSSVSSDVQVPLLKENPDIIIATPGRVVEHLSNGVFCFDDGIFKTLVVDEADLVLSYGYEEDLRKLLGYLPKLHHTMLMSATLSPEIDSLKALVLHNPSIIKMKEQQNSDDKLSQTYICCPRGDKFLLLYVLLKLNYIKGKTLFFVNSVHNCFKTKLLLEQFSIRSAVLNHELPFNSRYNIIQQFNAGNFDFLIATDQSIECDELKDEEKEKTGDEGDEGDEGDDGNIEISKHMSQKNRIINTQAHDNVSRGIDFRDVKTVVNISFPTTIKSYTHRVGRTARGGKTGDALSLACPFEEKYLQNLISHQAKIEAETGAPTIKQLDFDTSYLEGFRYRVESVRGKVGNLAIRDARLKEIRMEILNSQKLQSHFEDNPREWELLKHDRVLRPAQVESHLQHVPRYLVPEGIKINNTRGRNEKKRKQRRAFKKRRKNNDPLKTFNFKKKSGNTNRKSSSGKPGHGGKSSSRKPAYKEYNKKKRSSSRKTK